MTSNAELNERTMFTLAVTGGVGTGKSTASRILADLYGPRAAFFDCDESVHRWLTKPAVVEMVSDRFGSSVLDSDGAVDRGALGRVVFSNSADREFLEALLHPLVVNEGRERWQEAQLAEEPVELFVFEIPLLYESESELPHDLDLLIASSPGVQRQRLKDSRGMPGERIDAVIAAQMPMKDKVERASAVIWNDGNTEELTAQLSILSRRMDAATTRHSSAQ